jgi:hypothetical protein
MYAQQASIDPSLAALLQTAQMVTPDQTPTVAAQVAQAAAQKLQPQGIAQGMPEARQDFQDAMPSMMRNMQQQQMQQMVQQAMQPKPAGIEGLPSNIRMAEGGVVGFAGPEGSFVGPSFAQNLSDAEIERLTPEQRKAYYKQMLTRRNAPTPVPPPTSSPAMSARPGLGIAGAIAKKLGPLGLLAELFTTSDEDIALLNKAESERNAVPDDGRPRGQENYEPTPQLTVGNAPPMSPEAQRMTNRQGPRGIASAPPPPVQRPPAPAPAMQPAPQGGIAELIAPTPESAMASARSVLGMPGTEGLRKREEAFLAALKAQPATGQQGLAALQAQQAALQAMNEKAEKESNINSAIQWLLGGKEGAGGSARSSIAFSEREDARRRSYNDLQVANATKRDAIIDLQNARDVGNAKAALEAEQRIRAAEVDVAKAEATLAGQFASSQANVYGTQMQAETAAANRAQNERLERIRKATANQPGETERIFAEYTRRKAVDPKDAEAYLANIERIKGLGRGMDLKETSVELRALKDEEQQLLKRLEATYSSQERAPITARLEQISRDRVKLMGGTPTAAPTGGVVTPKSQAEFNALPKGARYINPADGKEYIKN